MHAGPAAIVGVEERDARHGDGERRARRRRHRVEHLLGLGHRRTAEPPPRPELQIPDGGMAAWTKFDPAINLEKLAETTLRHDLHLPVGKWVDTKIGLNAMRLGFASSTPEELEQCVGIMATTILA